MGACVVASNMITNGGSCASDWVGAQMAVPNIVTQKEFDSGTVCPSWHNCAC